jgi:FAD/FMN-containing dehydrogenase
MAGGTTDIARELRAALSGEVLVAGDGGYDDARRISNGAVDHRPAVIVRCQTTADVQAAVRAARKHGMALSVRGGGHDWAGRSIGDGALVVDLTRMQDVAIDAAQRTADIGGAPPPAR